jgi:predicted nucleotidyltransferase
MESNPHFRELLQSLSAHKAEFLIVGGYAVMKYTEPRYTKDLDIWIRNSPQNAAKVYAALAEFGAPLAADGLTTKDFSSSSMVYQIGRPPLRIDIITKITGVSFTHAWRRRKRERIAGVNVYFIGLEDLIRNKEASGRQSDAEHLKLLRKKGKK